MFLHANAKLGLAGRLALVRAIEEGLSLRAAAAAFNVSPATAQLGVHVVLDNSSTHETPSIQRWLLRHPLNLVERWFAELTTKWIKRGTHRSVRDLVASIRTWITD